MMVVFTLFSETCNSVLFCFSFSGLCSWVLLVRWCIRIKPFCSVINLTKTYTLVQWIERPCSCRKILHQPSLSWGILGWVNLVLDWIGNYMGQLWAVFAQLTVFVGELALVGRMQSTQNKPNLQGGGDLIMPLLWWLLSWIGAGNLLVVSTKCKKDSSISRSF